MPVARPNRFVRTLLGRIVLAAALVLPLAACKDTQPAEVNPFPADAPAPAPLGVAILQELESFGVVGTVLHVAAHPDDENTQLIAYLARARGYRTAYLSVTRGDGGQNVLGAQLGEKLGVARTQELLAARRIDGGRQFFTRALDFGFSKDYAETLQVWDRDEVLGDVVRVIRTFRPDVIVTRFSTTPGGTHGHHTASAVLALEAFHLAGDPRAYPEQLDRLTPWQPTRIFMNSGGGEAAPPGSVTLDIGGDDPVLAHSFASIASQSRGMHRTQNFPPGEPGAPGGPPRIESLQLLGGEPATDDFMDGIDTSWRRVPGGAEVARLVEDAVARFDTSDPAASVPELLDLRRVVAELPAGPVVDDKRAQLDRILAWTLGLEVRTLVPLAELVAGEALDMEHTVTVHSAVPVRWVAVRYPSVGEETAGAGLLAAGSPATRSAVQPLPPGTPLTQPYWLRQPGTAGMFRVDDPALIGLSEDPPIFPVEWVFEVGGQTLTVPDEPVQITSAEALGGRRRVDVVAPASFRFLPAVVLFQPGAAREVTVEVRAHRGGVEGSLTLDLPQGWLAQPDARPFRLAAAGDVVAFTFTVTAPPGAGVTTIGAGADIGGVRYDNQYVEVRYDHLPLQILQPPARLEAVAVEVETRGRTVGYLPGAGDLVSEGIEQLGYDVVFLSGADLTAEGLRGLDAVVFGVRAMNVREDLEAGLPALFSWVEGGGTLIVQYTQHMGLQTSMVAPFSLQFSADRVTDERATMRFLAPGHPALNRPNRITAEDFGGWVQERGLYFANEWDPRFQPILGANDPGEAPLRGGLLVAEHGQGYFVYTGLSFFRQLPAGVPGAYRLFANLLSLGSR